MSNQFPFIINRRVDPLPQLGWDWETYTQTQAQGTGALIQRTFSEFTLGTDTTIAYVNSKPKGYPLNDANAHYVVSNTLTVINYTGQAVAANDPHDPAFAENDFYGWRRTEVRYALDVIYVNKQNTWLTWRPQMTTWVHPTTGVSQQVPTDQYVFEIKNPNGSIISQTLQPSTATTLNLLLRNTALGAMQGESPSPNSFVYNTSEPNQNHTNLTNITTHQTLLRNHLKFVKPSSVYSAGGGTTPPSITNSSTINVYLLGEQWGGDLRFLNYVGPTTLLMHPLNATLLTRLKPPGKSNLPDTPNTVPIGTPTIGTKAAAHTVIT